MIVTIDGPAGAGKSTAARRVATRLGFRYLDTGAMYRAVTLAALERGVDVSDAAACGALAESITLDLRPDGAVMCDGKDVASAIREERVTARVSEVSAHASVRAAMTRLQRAVGRGGDLVCEGRDMGDVVFPDAALKVWLDAPPEVRAERRRKELQAAGESLSLSELLARMNERDRRDATRAAAPLRKAKDAESIDTAGLGLEQVVDAIASMAEERGARARR